METYYVQPSYQNEPLEIIRIESNLYKLVSKALKSQNATLIPAPTFEYFESELPKREIKTKNDI